MSCEAKSLLESQVTITNIIVKHATRVASKLASCLEMAAAAPVDMKNVDRIKSAIKEGKYPIDIDKISDALMDAYRELKS